MADMCECGDEISVEMDCLVQRQQDGLVNPSELNKLACILTDRTNNIIHV